MSPRAILVAAAPLVAALAAALAAFYTGFDQRLPMPVEAESRFYGFYLDMYPLFAFAIVYALVRVVASAFAPGASSIMRRILGCGVGVLIILALTLHPTFGGVTMRAAFATGGMSFLQNVPMPFAYLIGSAVAATLLGFAMGAGVLLIGRRLRAPIGMLRAAWQNLVGLLSRFVALWYAMALLGLARAFGLGPWPLRPLDIGDVILVCICLLVAFLPHVLLVAARTDAAAQAG